MPTLPLSKAAIQLRPTDNVAVAGRSLGPGTKIDLVRGN